MLHAALRHRLLFLSSMPRIRLSSLLSMEIHETVYLVRRLSPIDQSLEHVHTHMCGVKTTTKQLLCQAAWSHLPSSICHLLLDLIRKETACERKGEVWMCWTLLSALPLWYLPVHVCVCGGGREGGRGDDFWQIETKSEDECILHLHYANASFFVLLNVCLRGTRLACNSRCNDNQFARWPDSSAILRGCRCHRRGWRTDARERREGARRGKETGGKKMGPDLCYTGETLNICLCVQRCSWEKQIHMRACNHPHTCSHNTARKAILLYHKLCT